MFWFFFILLLLSTLGMGVSFGNLIADGMARYIWRLDSLFLFDKQDIKLYMRIGIVSTILGAIFFVLCLYLNDWSYIVHIK